VGLGLESSRTDKHCKTICTKIASKRFDKKKSREKIQTRFFLDFFLSSFWAFLGEGRPKTTRLRCPELHAAGGAKIRSKKWEMSWPKWLRWRSSALSQLLTVLLTDFWAAACCLQFYTRTADKHNHPQNQKSVEPETRGQGRCHSQTPIIDRHNAAVFQFQQI
jgi:hypothetical protein